MACRPAKRYMGTALSFDGVSNQVAIPVSIATVTSINASEFSISLTFKARANTGTRILYNSSIDTNDRFAININTTSLRIGLYNGTIYTSGRGGREIVPNNWYTITVVAQSGVITASYLNGVAYTPNSGLTPSTYSTNLVRFGRRVDGADNFEGVIDEPRIWNRALTPQEVSDLYFNDIVPTDGLVAEYLFDEGSGTTALDTSGNSNNGTITGATYTTDTPLNLPIAIDESNRSSLRNGAATTDDITVENSAGEVTDNISDQTFEVVFKPSQLQGATKYLFSIPATAGNNRRYLQLSATNTIGYNLGSTSSTLSYVALPHTWYIGHLVVDSVAQTADIWMNGKRIAKAIAFTVGTGTADIIFGNITSSGTDALIGYIKTGRVWNVKLTDEEIKNRVYAGVVPYLNNPNILKLNLTLNEGAGTIAYDQSGNGNNGTITGATWSDELPPQARTQYAGNLVKNGDFSYVPVVNVAQTTADRWFDGTAGGSTTNKLFNWYLNSVATSVSAIFDTSTLGPTGKPSIKLSTLDTTGRCYVSGADALTPSTFSGDKTKLIRLKPSTSYTLSGWVKTINCVSDSAYIELISFNGNYQSRIETQSNKLSGTNNWTFCTVTFTTASDRCYAYPQLRIEKAGNISDAWFSDISLTETTPPTRTTATTRTAVTCP